MKKIVILLLCLLLCGCTEISPVEPDEKNLDALKFKELYESYNGLTNDYGDTYTTVKISEDNPMRFASYDDVYSVLDESGVILFAFPECPWCRMSLPVLLDACKEVGIRKVYYMNNRDERDTIEISDGEPHTVKEASEEYRKLLKRLDDYALEYEFEDYSDSSMKRIYFPTVVVVKDGEVILYHTSTVESQTDPYVPLTENQYEELFETYKTALNKLRNTCSLDKGC